jgi:hypothetical protein
VTDPYKTQQGLVDFFTYKTQQACCAILLIFLWTHAAEQAQAKGGIVTLAA